MARPIAEKSSMRSSRPRSGELSSSDTGVWQQQPAEQQRRTPARAGADDCAGIGTEHLIDTGFRHTRARRRTPALKSWAATASAGIDRARRRSAQDRKGIARIAPTDLADGDEDTDLVGRACAATCQYQCRPCPFRSFPTSVRGISGTGHDIL